MKVVLDPLALVVAGIYINSELNSMCIVAEAFVVGDVEALGLLSLALMTSHYLKRFFGHHYVALCFDESHTLSRSGHRFIPGAFAVTLHDKPGRSALKPHAYFNTSSCCCGLTRGAH